MDQNAFSVSPRAEPTLVDATSALTILLAEDNVDMRRLLAYVLRYQGHAVVEAVDGPQTLEALAGLIVDGDEREFDLIIAEQSIPGIPALSILAGLRSRRRGTPFIVLTDGFSTPMASRAERLGGVMLRKPFTASSMRAAVRQAVTYRTAPPPLPLEKNEGECVLST